MKSNRFLVRPLSLLLVVLGLLRVVEVTDASGTWTTTDSMTLARTYPPAALLPTSKVLVAGGYNSCDVLASAELYDPSSGTWTTTASMTVDRFYHTATLLPTGKVLVAGGLGSSNSSSALASAELYTTDATPPTPSLTPTSTTVPSPTPTLPPGTGPVSKVWYFAEGRAGAGFQEFLTLGNPTATDCQVTITYLTHTDRGVDGTKTVPVTVKATHRLTEWIDGDLGTSCNTAVACSHHARLHNFILRLTILSYIQTKRLTIGSGNF